MRRDQLVFRAFDIFMVSCFVFGALIFCPVNVSAEQGSPRPSMKKEPIADNTETMPDFDKIMKSQMEAMGSMWGRMAEDMINSTVNTMSRPEVADKMATFTKNYFDALISKGFTREEALRIVMSVHIPTASGK